MPAYQVTTDKVAFGKQHYMRDAVIEVSSGEMKHAETLRKIGKLKVYEGEAKSPTDLPDEVMARAAKAEPLTEEDAPKPARTYQRRDMVAEAPKAKRGRPAGKAKK